MSTVFLTALAISGLGMVSVLRLLERARVVDVPNARSSHVTPTPRGGGLALVVGVVVAVGVAAGEHEVPWLLLLGIIAFAGLGFADDFRGLDVRVRLAVQILVSAVVGPFVISGTPVASIVVSIIAVIWLVGYTNAFNFMDGVNGISGMNAALAGAWFGYLGITQDLYSVAALGFAVAGAAVGFLPWNAPQAKVFLGDVGSYGLGFSVAVLALLAWSDGVSLLLVLAPLSVYLADTGWALIKRAWIRESWAQAHREHVYQRLTDRGWPHLASGGLPAMLAATVCAFALMLESQFVIAVLTAAMLAAYLGVPSLLSQSVATKQDARVPS